jgi:hypothetical protein
MIRLDNLAYSLPDCDVIALTGDCTSLIRPRRLSDTLNAWPQKLKLSVPDNHDLADTFDLLSAWKHQTPWSTLFNDVLFIGLDSSRGFGNVAEQLSSTQPNNQANATVILSHRWPESNEINVLEKLLNQYVGNRPLLVLHGHAHPPSFDGLLWHEPSAIGDRAFYRSKVCSSVSRKRGLGHLITWNGAGFTRTEVQGPPTSDAT